MREVEYSEYIETAPIALLRCQVDLRESNRSRRRWRFLAWLLLFCLTAVGMIEAVLRWVN